MRLFSSDRVSKMMDRLGHVEGDVIQHSMITKSIERAQKKVEENNFGIRKRLLEYDDVMNAQREVIYKRRRHALHGDRIRTDIANMFFELVEASVLAYHPEKQFESFRVALLRDFGIEPTVDAEGFATTPADDIAFDTYQAAERLYRSKLQELAQRAHPVIQRVHDDPANDFKQILVPFSDGRKTMQVATDIERSVASEGVSVMESLEKSVVLAIIDQYWKEHLRNMDDLRSNVQLARFEQKDPLLIYKFESYELFKAMVQRMNADVAAFLMRCTIPTGPAAQQVRQAPQARPAMPNKISLSKENIQNIQEQAASQARQQVPVGLRQGQHGPGTAMANSSSPTPPPQRQMPVRSEKKFGRNDLVVIRRGEEKKELKYKKVEPFLEQGWFIEGPANK